MTQRILLALALTLAALPLTTPTALACGEPPSPTDEPAAREAIERYVTRVFREPPANVRFFYLDDRDAYAWVQLRPDDQATAYREVRLERRGAAWHVVALR